MAILENGLKFKPLTVNPGGRATFGDAQVQPFEIAGIFRVPPHMIGDLEKSTFSNIEHQSIDFVKFSLSPWLKSNRAVHFLAATLSGRAQAVLCGVQA